MNSIIIEGTHPVFFKTAEEETELLVNGGEKERFYYICCRGIQTLSAQRKLLAGGERWIELQQTVHPEMWNYRLFSELRRSGILPPDDRSEEEAKADFLKWLRHNMICSPLAYKSEKEYGVTSQLLMAAGACFSKLLSEEEQTIPDLIREQVEAECGNPVLPNGAARTDIRLYPPFPAANRRSGAGADFPRRQHPYLGAGFKSSAELRGQPDH